MTEKLNYKFTITEQQHKQRLDTVLATNIPDFSRNQIKEWIKKGSVNINNINCCKAKTTVMKDQIVTVNVTLEPQLTAKAEDIAIEKLFEDNDIMIIYKPPGLIVHPGAGNPSGTLLNALLHDNNNQNKLPRAGIIHRLDKDTSGVMMIAKTPLAFQNLTKALAERDISRSYYAIADGLIKQSQTIEQPIGRDPIHRQKMAINTQGKNAITHIKIKERLNNYTLIDVKLETGRTHQIRVHMKSINHPLLGDKTYGKHKGYHKLPKEIAIIVSKFPRQALHAYKLELQHPVTKKILSFSKDIPSDMQQLIDILSLDK